MSEPPALVLSQLQRNDKWQGELPYLSKDGHRIDVASVWILERDADGAPGRVVDTFVDISGQRSQLSERGASGDLRRAQQVSMRGRSCRL